MISVDHWIFRPNTILVAFPSTRHRSFFFGVPEASDLWRKAAGVYW